MGVPTPEKLLSVPTTKCSLGCPLLDRCLGGGGVPCNSVTEIVAESSSGKTQLCLQLCLSAQLPPSLGGLSASSLFLYSEPPFPLRRLRQLSRHFSDRNPSSAADPADNIFVRAVLSADQLLDEMPSITSFIISRSKSMLPVRLIVVDSIAALFRSEFDNTPADLRRRSSLFFKISGELKSLAKRFDLAVVVTNQVVDFIQESQPGGSGLRIGNLRWLCSSGRRVCPALGVSWANCVNSRLFLSREEYCDHDRDRGDRTVETNRRIHVIFAPHLPESSTEFVIRREGVFGVQ